MGKHTMPVRNGPGHHLGLFARGLSLVLLLAGSVTALSQERPGWTLVWADEFAGPDGSAPDPAHWTFDLGGGGWGNNELQSYTDRPENARVVSGNLVIEAREESYTGTDGIPRNYTSARLHTQGKHSWTYGRVEARMQIPRGQGLWPAFWMLGTEFGAVRWPDCGEIDIMEAVGKEPYTTHGTAHGPGYSGGNGIGGSYTLLTGGEMADDFHVFTMLWSTNRIEWLVDDQSFFTLTPSLLPTGTAWVFDRPYFLLMNAAVGGNWPGAPDETTTFPQQLLVDYVRVYTANDDGTGNDRLVNGDFETGTPGGVPNGWTGTGGWAINPNGTVLQSTNGWVYGSSDSVPNPAFGTQSCKVYGDFNGHPNTMGCYQELSTGAGSLWTAAGKVQTAAPDIIQPDNEVWLEVSFRDENGFPLALFRSDPVDATDPVDTWLDLLVLSEFKVADESSPPSASTSIGSVTNLVAPAGTVRVRCHLKFYQPLYQGGSVYFDEVELVSLSGTDPELTDTPTDRTEVEEGVTVFEVTAEGTPPITYRWSRNAVPLNDGTQISGAFTDTLTITNLTVADSGLYAVQVLGSSPRSAEAHLKVITEEEAVNLLNNPGFEDGTNPPTWETGWTRFGGGALETTNHFVNGSGGSIRVASHTGTYVNKTWNGATDNGLYQDVPAVAGRFYSADAWFRSASPDTLTGNNECWLIVQFRNSSGGILEELRSTVIDLAFAADTWVNLDVSNTAGSRYLQAPLQTAAIRFLVYFRGQADSEGSVYCDDMRLLEKGPTPLSMALQEDTVALSFPTRLLNTYRLWSREVLHETNWTELQAVPGDGSILTIPRPPHSPPRFFSVTTE